VLWGSGCVVALPDLLSIGPDPKAAPGAAFFMGVV